MTRHLTLPHAHTHHALLSSPQELKRWGIKTVSHRRKFLEGRDKIQTVKSEGASVETDEAMDNGDVSESPPLFGSQSPSSQEREALPLSSSSATAASRSEPLPPTRLTHHPMAQLSSSQQSFAGGSQGSHVSIGSTQPFLSSTFEVLQIQLRKKFNQPH